MGMWVNRRSHCRTHQRPATLETSAPVNSKPMATRISPKPGTAASQCRVSWGKMCSLVSVPMKMPSSESTNQLSTATVIASGVQTNRPASRYFLIGMDGFRCRAQWQAQEPPQAPAALVVSVVVALALSALLALPALPEEPPLKSVAYQPEPLS